METLELQVKTAAEATTVAAAQLGVSPSDIKVTVIEESPGLFGKKKLKVQVERMGAEPAPAAKPARGKKAAEKAEPAPVATEEAVETPEPKKAKSERAAKPARGAKPAPAPAAAEVTEDSEGAETAEGPEIVATQEDADQILAIIKEILEIADLEAEARLRQFQGRYVEIELDGKDVSYLVGKSGEVLNAFQYVVNLMLNKKLDNGVRVTIDGNNYRTRREELLRNLATNVAREVINRGEEAVFDSMPAFERRIVHKVLSEIEGVQTYSEGEEPNRRVVVAPA